MTIMSKSYNSTLGLTLGKWGYFKELEGGDIQFYPAEHNKEHKDLVVCIHAMNPRFPFTGICMACVGKLEGKL